MSTDLYINNRWAVSSLSEQCCAVVHRNAPCWHWWSLLSYIWPLHCLH